MNGRRLDVLIKDRFDTDIRTGVELLSDYVTVHADAGKKELIQSVDGVVDVMRMHETEYMVKIDPRYDREYVKRDIEAAILVGNSEVK